MRISKTAGQRALTSEQREMLKEAGFPVTEYEFIAETDDAREIYGFWQLLRNQTVSGGMGIPLSINVATVLSVLELYAVPQESRSFYLEMLVYISTEIYAAASEAITKESKDGR